MENEEWRTQQARSRRQACEGGFSILHSAFSLSSAPESALSAALRRWAARAPLWLREAAGLLTIYAAFYLLLDTNALRYPPVLTPSLNSNVAEAAAILDGRLTLEARIHDTALFEGKVYNVYPPAFTLISLAILPWWPDGVHTSMLMLLTLPLPALVYVLFRQRAAGVGVAVVLTLAYAFGTSMLPVLDRALGGGDVYHVNHLLSQIGLLIFLLDYFGRRRIWPGAIGLLIAAWSRQLTAAFAAVIAAMPLTLNALKFGHPLDSGYRYIYAGSSTRVAHDAGEFGLFSPRYVGRNLYTMNLGLPLAEWINGVVRFKPDPWGTGIWWTTPLLLFLWADHRRWRAEPASRMLLAAVAAVVGVQLFYHTTGWEQPGYNRFSLDYLPVVLAVIAPGCGAPQRRVLTPALAAWSIWYFRWAVG